MTIREDSNRKLIVADCHIPDLRGRLEPFAEVRYLEPADIKPETVADADALIVRTRTACGSSLLADSKVRFIATATIGTDHLDLPWLASAGIKAVNAPGCNAPGVAQYVWASVLALKGDAKGLKVGVVGKGNVGSIVADWGRRLGAEILVCDPPRMDAGMTDEEYLPLETLLSECDVVTLHTPFEKGGDHPTFHMISAPQLSQMKPGAILINAARGGVVADDDLVEAIGTRHISAVIDTWENEPRISSRLLNLASLATPHIAGYSLEGKQRATRMAVEATADFFGWDPDLSGLEGPYVRPERVEASVISDSYSPIADTLALRMNPDGFERLRSEYITRNEPDFGC